MKPFPLPLILVSAATFLTSATSRGQALYGIYRETASGSDKHVVSINPSTGVATNEATQTFAAGNPYNWGYSAANQTAYGAVTESGNRIMSFDTNTNATSLSPALAGPGTFTQFNLSAVDRDTGNIYAILRDPTTVGNPDIIGSVDIGTGVISQIGSPFDNGGFTFPLLSTFNSVSDTFVFVSQDPANGNALSYFNVNANSGVATIAALAGSSASAIGHDHVTDTLYGLFSSGGTGQLAMINPLTGISTTIGSSFDLSLWEQTFTVDAGEGVAYLTGRTSGMGTNDRALYSVDLGTGAATITTIDLTGISPALANGPNALFVASVPEPGNLALLVFGAGLLAIRRRKAR